MGLVVSKLISLFILLFHFSQVKASEMPLPTLLEQAVNNLNTANSQITDGHIVSCETPFNAQDPFQGACTQERVAAVAKVLDQGKAVESKHDSEIDRIKGQLVSACIKTSALDWPSQLPVQDCSDPGKCQTAQGPVAVGEDLFALPKAPAQFHEDILKALGESNQTIEAMMAVHCRSSNSGKVVISPATFAESLISDYCSRSNHSTGPTVSGLISSLWAEKQMSGQSFLSEKWRSFRKYQDEAMAKFPLHRACKENSSRCQCETLANARNSSVKVQKDVSTDLGNLPERMKKIWSMLVDKMDLGPQEKKLLFDHYEKSNMQIMMDPIDHEFAGSFNNEAGRNLVRVTNGFMQLLKSKDFAFAAESTLAHELGHFLVRSLAVDPILNSRLSKKFEALSICTKQTLASLRPPSANAQLWVHSRHEELMCDYVAKIHTRATRPAERDYMGRLAIMCPEIVQRRVGRKVDLEEAFSKDSHLHPSTRIKLLSDGIINGNKSCESLVTAP